MKYEIEFTHTVTAVLTTDAFDEENAKEIIIQGCYNEKDLIILSNDLVISVEEEG